MCSPTPIYMNGTVRSWLHYCDVRCPEATQLEHREVADAVRALLREHLPTVAEAMWAE